MGTIARMDVRLGMDGSDFDKGIARAQASAESFSQKLTRTGTAMSIGVTAPLAGIATMALRSAGDFEASMNVLQSVSGATAGQMAALEAQALELGASTSFSAGDAANAMLELGKAGMDTTAIMGAMPGVLSLAAAGNMDVGTAAGIAANAVNTFGLAASETTTVANMLAAAANASSADVSDLAAGFQMAGSVFASNGQSMADLTTGMALMANAGIAGSDAGTSLKTMLMRLAAPTQESADAMAALGLNVYNSDGSMRSFEAIVGDLSIATEGLTDAQRNAALSTIFGADAIRAANVLTAAGAEGFAAMEAQVTAAGAAEEAAAARMKGLNGAMDYLQGSIDSLLIALSAQFLPIFANMARGVADLVSSFASLSPELQMGAIAFAAVAAAAGPVMLAVSGIGAALGFILSPIGLVIAAVAALAAAWTLNLGGIQEITAGAVAAVVQALQSVIAPIQLVAAAMADAGVNSIEANEAITALPASLQPLATGFQNIYAATVAALPSLQGVAAAMLDAGVNSIEANEAISALPAGLQPVAAGFQSVVANVTAAALALQTFLAPAIARAQDAFAGIGSKIGELAGPLAGLQEAFIVLWAAVQPLLAALAQAVGVTLAVAVDMGINTFAAVIANLPGLIGPSINQVTETITLIASTVSDMVALVKAAINGDWDGVWKSAQDIFGNFSTYINATVGNLSAIVTAVFATIAQAVTGTLTDMGVNVRSVLSSLESFWVGIWEGMSKAIKPVLDAIDGLKKGIQDFQSWISGISIPNPFAGIQMPSLPSLPALPSLPGFAAGGTVTGGEPIIVGERGPEVYIPNRSGTIIPNDELGGMWGDMAGSGANGGAVVLNHYGNVVSPLDLKELAYEVAQLLNRRRM